MCLLAISVDSKPIIENLRKAWALNPDGAGIAWINSKTRKTEYIKGIPSLAELNELIKTVELPFVWHLRKASVGGVSQILTQPFEITEKSSLRLHNTQCDRVLFQNGTEYLWDKYLAASGLDEPTDKDGKLQPMSDSRAFAMILSQHKNNKFLHFFESRFVVVGYNSATDENAFRYYGNFTEEDGILYSNMEWKWKSPTVYYNGVHKQSNYDNDDWRHDTSDYGVDLSQVKKKVEAVSVPEIAIESALNNGKPLALYTKKEKSDYAKWWNLHAPYAASMKYPLALPPNTVEAPKKPTIEEIQAAFFGCGC